MKGVILAGGNGTRLQPLTFACNKHLLPIGEKPMILHCVEKMTEAGIGDILVVTGGEHLGGIAEFLGNGSKYQCQITYRVQNEAGGIAQALGMADGFVRSGEQMCVLLGDNIFESSMKPLLEAYEDQACKGAMVVLKIVPDPRRFGVPVFRHGSGPGSIEIKAIEEKPENPKSSFAVVGIYFYDSTVFNVISRLKPSARGELEITDVNNYYIQEGTLGWMEMKGWWTDAGTHESYRRANELIAGR
jgi:glucose-1-phosphate thymidylyltransferase